MSIKRVFLATKKDLTMGAICDVMSRGANKFEHKYESSQQGLAATREVALSAVVEVLKKADTKELEAPIQVFCVSSLSDMITNQTYKYWIISGKKNDGTDVHPEELKLWKEFDKLMSKKGLYFIFKNLMNANFNGTPKFNQGEVIYNKFYFDWCWEAIHKVYPKGPALPSAPEMPVAE